MVANNNSTPPAKDPERTRVASVVLAMIASNPNTPQGSQVAFIQSLGSFNQTVTLPAGSYAIDFSAAQRGNFVSGETFKVLVDGVSAGGFNNLLGTGYTALETSSFTVTAGSHIITFQ